MAVGTVARRVILAGIWISFVIYTLWLAPLDRPYTWSFAQRLVTLQWGEINAYLLAIFWLMGVWPMIYACLMFADGRMQPFPAWPFFVGSRRILYALLDVLYGIGARG